jgi:HD-GYP domain-containing protein (c-di-GMP phosphodiesterase class II)
MTAEPTKIPFLIVSASPYMRGILKFVLETLLQTEVTELESEEKALSFLRNVTHQPSMIIYDYTPNAYLLEDFVGFLKEQSKSVRITVLVDEIREEGRELLKGIQQLKLMQKSSLPGELVEESQKTFADSPFLNTSAYCRIDIDFLTKLDGINKNLFIRLGSDKYIKIFNEDDNTDVLDIKKYKEKGIQYLFVNRDTALWITTQIQKQINVFLKANNFRFILRGANDSPVKRFEQKILRIDDEVHVDAEFKQIIDKAIDNIRAIVEKDQKIEHTLAVLKQHKAEYAFFTQKMNLTSVISCILAKQLDWISKSTIDKLVYASVLCDITLAVKPELLRIRSMSDFEKIKHTLSDDDQKIFLSHPKDAANLIKRYFSSAPPETDALVFQHHEQPDGNGFPLRVKAERISPLTALFIVANDFAYYFLCDDEPTMDDFMLKCSSRYDFVNFRKVVKVLERVNKR